MEFLITAIVAVILLVGVVSSCPSVCSCTVYSNGVQVNCSSKKNLIVFQQIYLATLIHCKSVITKR